MVRGLTCIYSGKENIQSPVLSAMGCSCWVDTLRFLWSHNCPQENVFISIGGKKKEHQDRRFGQLKSCKYRIGQIILRVLGHPSEETTEAVREA